MHIKNLNIRINIEYCLQVLRVLCFFINLIYFLLLIAILFVKALSTIFLVIEKVLYMRNQSYLYF